MIREDSIVVTGIGAVGAFGRGRAALAAALARGTPRVSAVDRSSGWHGERAARTALLVDPRAIEGAIPPLEARRMSPPSRFAVVAASDALADAAISVSSERDPDLAVAMATSFGPTSFTQRLVDQLLDEGPAAASPALFIECVANAPAGRVALSARAAGSNSTFVMGEAGSLFALGRAARWIASGRARVTLAGAVDEMTPLLHALLDRFRALARSERDGVERARPFDRRRDGFLAAEGATLVVLEREAAARRRGRQPIARVVGGWSAFDPTAPQSAWGHGHAGLAAALRSGLSRHGTEIDEIDLVVSGASGSRAGDRLEAGVLRRAWGERPLPPIVAPKSVTGEYGGAFIGAALLIAAGNSTMPVLDFDADEAGCGLSLHRGPPYPPPRRTLVSALSSGGAATWLLLERA